MKKTVSFLTIAILMLMMGCQKTDDQPTLTSAPEPVGDLKAAALIPIHVGKDNPSGTLIVENIPTGFLFTALLNGWEFLDNHIYIGTEEPPRPAPGQFPYSGTIGIPASTLSFFISYDDLGATCGTFYIAFQADVTNGEDTEGAWAIHSANPIYWYNPAGKKIGWGAYFAFTISCGPQIDIVPATEDLNTVFGKIRYRNFNINTDLEPEIYHWDDGSLGFPFPVNFSTSPDCDGVTQPNGQYLFAPQKNHIFLQYTPDFGGMGFFYASIETSHSFCSQVFTVANADFNAIQFYILERNDLSGVVLSGINVNGTNVEGEYFVDLGDGDDLRFNIIGEIQDAGGFIFQADLLLEGDSGGPEQNYVEISFGQM